MNELARIHRFCRRSTLTMQTQKYKAVVRELP